MAWTTNIDKKDVENNQIVVYVTYSSDSGANPFSEIIPFPKSASLQDISYELSQKENDLNNADSVTAQISVGKFTPTIPEQSVADPLQVAYEQASSLRRQVLDAIAEGSIHSGDPLDTNSLALVKSAFAAVSTNLSTAIASASQGIKSAQVQAIGG